ncbi:RNA pseudouridine synthase 3, mitochondrial isoform X2 [Macadamia integrifolia]|uniref:RNA pseudouridine synthase 3, mitochondrial isoform X2 n=1 Tax=Macadamia integrifolia TaxID=60698 RepID=UPI001C4F8492|nr:RNA pseudouridine synthase 3, mitochondrial isoform X2 [Macadamia integrifolia]
MTFCENISNHLRIACLASTDSSRSFSPLNDCGLNLCCSYLLLSLQEKSERQSRCLFLICEPELGARGRAPRNGGNEELMRWKLLHGGMLHMVRHFSRVSSLPPAHAAPVIRVHNNIARLGSPKADKKPRQLLSLPAFPGLPLPGKRSVSVPGKTPHVTAISWVKYYFDDIPGSVIQSHFNKGLIECPNMDDSSLDKQGQMQSLRKIGPSEVMEAGMRIYVPVSVAETKISKRFDTIPSGTFYPNADEIEYLQRLVIYKDPAIIVLNKPPKLPVKGNMPVHNSMDALAAAALSYGYEEGPKLVHRLDRESSGLLLMGRTKDSNDRLHWLFSDVSTEKSSSKPWNDACQATVQRYWALVIGSPKEKEGVIHAPLSKVLLNDGKTERVILAHHSGVEPSQQAITEYRVLGPTVNGCTWIELCPHTGRKYQVHGVSSLRGTIGDGTTS